MLALAITRSLSGCRCRSVYRTSATGQRVGVGRRVMRKTRQWRWMIVTCRAACVLLALLASACSSSD